MQEKYKYLQLSKKYLFIYLVIKFMSQQTLWFLVH